MITTTISSSISVKPFRFFNMREILRKKVCSRDGPAEPRLGTDSEATGVPTRAFYDYRVAR
jgi:hypothetical protein